jgi:hypothetical protein
MFLLVFLILGTLLNAFRTQNAVLDMKLHLMRKKKTFNAFTAETFMFNLLNVKNVPGESRVIFFTVNCLSQAIVSLNASRVQPESNFLLFKLESQFFSN